MTPVPFHRDGLRESNFAAHLVLRVRRHTASTIAGASQIRRHALRPVRRLGIREPTSVLDHKPRAASFLSGPANANCNCRRARDSADITEPIGIEAIAAISL